MARSSRSTFLRFINVINMWCLVKTKCGKCDISICISSRIINHDRFLKKCLIALFPPFSFSSIIMLLENGIFLIFLSAVVIWLICYVLPLIYFCTHVLRGITGIFFFFWLQKAFIHCYLICKVKITVVVKCSLR